MSTLTHANKIKRNSRGGGLSHSIRPDCPEQEPYELVCKRPRVCLFQRGSLCWVLENACLPLSRAVESVGERELVCAFPEQNVHVNFREESLFAQEKLSELVRGALF
jgi:hypothetical protein